MKSHPLFNLSLIPLIFAVICLQRASFAQDTDSTFYYLYTNETDEDKAIQYAELFINGLDTLTDNPKTITLLNEISRYYGHVQFKFSKSIGYLERLISLYKYHDTRAGESYYELANMYHRLKRYDKTLEYTLKSIDFARKKGDSTTVMKNYNLLAITHMVCKDFSVSKRYFDEFYKRAVESEDSVTMFLAINNLAAYYYTSGDTARIMPLLDKALEMVPENDTASCLFKVKMNQASYIMSYKDWKSFEELIKEVSKLASNIEEHGRVHHNLGYYYSITGKPELAVEEYQSALSYFQQGEFYQEQKDILMSLGNLYASTKDTANAYAFLKQYVDITQAQPETENMLTDLFHYKNTIEANAHNELLSRLKHRQTLTIIIIASLFIVISCIYTSLYIVYRLRKKHELLEIDAQKKLNEQIEKEMRNSLELKKMYEFKNRQVIHDIYQDLQTLQTKTDSTSTKNDINTLCRKLLRAGDEVSAPTPSDSQYVPEFNSQLISRLSSDFPSLSINDRRLCAFLNLNMTTKEIADITKQNPQTINIARARLRKKLGLNGSSMSIHEFLLRYQNGQ